MLVSRTETLTDLPASVTKVKLHIHGFWVSLLMAGFALGAFQPELKDPKLIQTYSVPEAYEVYSAVLPDDSTWRYANSKILLIKAETVSYQMCLTPDAESARLLDPAIVDFRIVNGTTWNIARKLDISKLYELAPGAALQASFKTNGASGWSAFEREHPDSVGWIELSAVGFNHDKTIAIVYVGHHCGGLCGGGGFRVLHKAEGKWKEMTWNGGSCAWAS